ncbi:hypothetical protein ACEPPN_009309 [Leptodophora sp. 'Broadleaf-Isolate-01']
MLQESAKTNEIVSRDSRAKGVVMREKENHMIINCSEVADDESITGEQRDIDLEVQILAAKNVNPMKLVTLLRIRFGIGRYEIQRMRGMYNIRTPRRLSVEELEGCRWD